MKNEKVLSQTKLKASFIIGFSLIILILSSTKIGYIPISDSHSLDLSIVPAIFAAMIGGYQVGIPLAVIWTLISYHNPASNTQMLSLWEFMAVQVLLLASVTWFYKWFKKKNRYSPWNVYYAIIAAVLLKNVLISILFLSKANYIKGALEMALCLLAMSLAIKHLRQIHLLNGVKKKQEQEEQAEEVIQYARVGFVASSKEIGRKNFHGRLTEKL